MKYGLDNTPPPAAFLLYGLQWWVVSLPCVVILGTVVAGMHSGDPVAQVASVQRLFILIGLIMLTQLFLGHRLPLNPGPASTLLIGLGASMSLGRDAQYTAIAVGGLALALVGYCGVLQRLRRFFTPRIVSVVLILIAVTLTPTILKLLFPSHDDPGAMAVQFAFLFVMIFILIYANARLPGLAKSLTVLLGIAGGSAAYFLLFGAPVVPGAALVAPPAVSLVRFSWDGGALLAFLFCFLALAINEVGSIESLGHMLGAPDMDTRLRRGVGLTGLANLVCGCIGTIGPVDYALSSGIIAATGCAARYTMIPAALGLLACGFSPAAVTYLLAIPTPVLGVLFLYIMATQLASGLVLLSGEKGVRTFNGGVIVALPLMLGLFVTFSPTVLWGAFPSLLRPLLANGFVMGIIAVIVLEHWLLRQRG